MSNLGAANPRMAGRLAIRIADELGLTLPGGGRHR